MSLASLIAIVSLLTTLLANSAVLIPGTGQSHGRKSRAWYHKLLFRAKFSKFPFLPTL
jgi:hypothetical protein